MKVELSINGDNRELIYPENVVWIGYISHSRGLTVSTGFDLFFDNVTKAEEKLTDSETDEATILVYYSEDKRLQDLIGKYKGLRIYEVSYNGLVITATI